MRGQLPEWAGQLRGLAWGAGWTDGVAVPGVSGAVMVTSPLGGATAVGTTGFSANVASR